MLKNRSRNPLEIIEMIKYSVRNSKSMCSLLNDSEKKDIIDKILLKWMTLHSGWPRMSSDYSFN